MTHDKGGGRSLLDTAASAAKLAAAVRRIAKAAATGGWQAALIAAVPYFGKLMLWLVIGLLAMAMVVFTAIPSMFFGFANSETDSIQRMNANAAAVGGIYMSVADFERTQMDAVITGVLSEYETSGITVENVTVTSDFEDDDLLWVIAINSVAYQQDLDAMTAENVRELCTSRLKYGSVFSSSDTSVVIHFDKLDPEKTMEELSFSEEAKMWATALYETLSESDALNTYRDQFPAQTTDYSGTTWSGIYDHGESYGNEIDLSGFSDPSTKNNRDLAAYAIQAWENNWGYVWGTFGGVFTPSLFEYKLRQYPDGVGNYADFIREHWLNRRTTDCIGLVKGYGWLDAETGSINYATNGMPDFAADQMYQNAVASGADHGSLSAIPEIPGLVLWIDGHTGVYIGGGYEIEAMGTKYGVVRTEIAGRGWKAWYKIPYITYLD